MGALICAWLSQHAYMQEEPWITAEAEERGSRR
ncbi:hypothetical protein FHX70_000743 [Slackia isoflavoniconvertens]|nr:hypothetical protein [Slackia isoflavoniconvertens]